jgi:hypothetical protein
MRYKGTIILLILIVLSGLYLYFIELPGQKAKQQEEEKSQKITTVQIEDVVGIYLNYPKRSTDQEILLEKDSAEKWQLVKPIVAPADQSEVQGLISSVNNMRIERVVEEKAEDLKVYGLDQPEVKVSLKLKDSEEHLLFGDSAPVGSTVYVKKAGEDLVRLTDQYNKANLTKTVTDLRKKEVLDINPQQVRRLSLQYSGQNFVLEKEDGRWWIKKPVAYRADDDRIVDLLDSLERLQAKDFIDQEPPGLLKGFKNPRLKVEVDDENTRRSTLSVFQAQDGDQGEKKAYAVTHLERPIYVIDSNVITNFEKDLFDLKDKHLMSFSLDQVQIIEIRKTVGEPIAIQREGDRWSFERQILEPSENQKISDFLKDLSELKAEKMVDETPQSVNPYGLNPPEVQVSLLDSQQNKLGELLIGGKKDELVYAKSEPSVTLSKSSRSEGDIFLIRGDIIQNIPEKEDLKKQAAEKSSS